MDPYAVDPGLKFLLLAALLVGAILVFARVRFDYTRHRRLTRLTAIIQTTFFGLYALSSYVFLDSRVVSITVSSPVFWIAALLMTLGFLVVVLSMPFLGLRSFGRHVGSLHTTGPYHFTRNPQLVGGFLFVVGYALLWPSILGFLWAALWLPIAHLMVRCEEAHLLDVFGKEYVAYCARTPRYLGLPRKWPRATR